VFWQSINQQIQTKIGSIIPKIKRTGSILLPYISHMLFRVKLEYKSVQSFKEGPLLETLQFALSPSIPVEEWKALQGSFGRELSKKESQQLSFQSSNKDQQYHHKFNEKLFSISQPTRYNQ